MVFEASLSLTVGTQGTRSSDPPQEMAEVVGLSAKFCMLNASDP